MNRETRDKKYEYLTKSLILKKYLLENDLSDKVYIKIKEEQEEYYKKYQFYKNLSIAMERSEKNEVSGSICRGGNRR